MENYSHRLLSARLPKSTDRRLVVLTGARQTGKTTLVQKQYPDQLYLNLDDIDRRSDLRDLPTAQWGTAVGPAVLDEAQKEPSVVAFQARCQQALQLG